LQLVLRYERRPDGVTKFFEFENRPECFGSEFAGGCLIENDATAGLGIKKMSQGGTPWLKKSLESKDHNLLNLFLNYSFFMSP